MTTLDPTQRFVDHLEGTGLSLFVVSIVGGIVSLVVVGARTYFRLKERNFSFDDGLMLSGLVVYLADVALACVGALSGLGRRNADLSATMMVESIKYLMIWMLLYVIALCLVKSSICITTLRIATTMPKLRVAVYVLLGLIIATFLTTFIGILLLCRPVEANWDASLIADGRGECSPVTSMLGLSYTSTASTIATDLACAVLPAIILMQTQMRLSTKIMVATFLSFGSFASVSTMIRTPYIDHYNRPLDDLAYHIGNIPLWSNVETAIGLIAGSLPALRQFVMRHRAPRATTRGTEGSIGLRPPSAGLVTIGGSGGTSKIRGRKGMKSNFEIDEADQGDWTRLEEDNGSDKDSTVPIRGIRKDMTYEVETLVDPGDKIDYDLWGEAVGDDRWTYDGLLPYMKKAETFWDSTINSDQHGYDGPVGIQSVTSTKRPFPLREKVLQSWHEIGVEPIPLFDGNAGNPLGVAEYTENKSNGRREIAAAVYSLENVTVLTDTQVAKVLLSNSTEGLIATGIELANGTHILGRQTILSAGAVHTPQLLMLSGIGPRDELEAVGVDVKLEAPEVGKNYADHFLSPSTWNVKNPEEGWAVGSPAFPTAEQYSWGTATDFIVCSSVPKEGLAKAIEEDEGAAPGADHPLLKQERTFFEHFFLYSGSTDGSKVAISGIFILPTSRGSIKLASGNITDSPLIDPNYLATAVDRYIVREGIRQEIAFAGSDATVLGREILDGESVPAGFDEVYTVNSTDEYIDARIRAAA
ncbi:glucose dehydrogenase, partial [Colletotrichum asianum]